MIKILILITLFLIAIFYCFVSIKINKIKYKGKEVSMREESPELFTEDVVDEDLDDPYNESDWTDIAYNSDSWKEDDYNDEILMLEDEW